MLLCNTKKQYALGVRTLPFRWTRSEFPPTLLKADAVTRCKMWLFLAAIESSGVDSGNRPFETQANGSRAFGLLMPKARKDTLIPHIELFVDIVNQPNSLNCGFSDQPGVGDCQQSQGADQGCVGRDQPVVGDMTTKHNVRVALGLC